MRISTKGRYGTRLMLDLAGHYGSGPIFLKEIAARQEISEKYLWHLIPPLRNAGMIISTRGAHGGYEISQHPREITLKKIIEVLEGEISLVECSENPSFCQRMDGCVVSEIWSEVSERISRIFESYTLEDLLEKQRKRTGIVTYSI